MMGRNLSSVAFWSVPVLANLDLSKPDTPASYDASYKYQPAHLVGEFGS